MYTVLCMLMVAGFLWVLIKLGGAILQILAILAFGIIGLFLAGFAVGFLM